MKLFTWNLVEGYQGSPPCLNKPQMDVQGWGLNLSLVANMIPSHERLVWYLEQKEVVD